jgi:Lrp/AsnC family transcriptional regulator
MDKTDLRILELLQRDGSMTTTAVAERVGLSKVPCWRRIQQLRSKGIIQGVVALLNPRRVGVGTTVFVTIRTATHSAAWFEKFSRVASQIPEIVEIYRMSGDVDYLMRIVVSDIDAYDRVYKRLIAAVDFQDVSASFALETIKSTTVLPLHYAEVSD